jgi:glycosyltransferase involved in cell wall biosynthesis
MSIKLWHIGTGIGIAVLGAELIKNGMLACQQDNIPLYNPEVEDKFISINVCTYNEEQNIEIALNSILQQNVIQAHLNCFELLVIDSGSEDATVEYAQQYARVIQAPRGKLTARAIGIEESRGNIIVNYDADVEVPQGSLNRLLSKFIDNTVVGVTGSTVVADDNTLFNSYSTLFPWWCMVDSTVLGCRSICGRNSAFLKQAYYDVGGWNLNINQMDRLAMVNEEEIHFGQKLKGIGRLVYELKATVITSRVANTCGPDNNSLYCKQRRLKERF